MIRTQFVALGGLALAVACSAGLGIANGVHDRSLPEGRDWSSVQEGSPAAGSPRPSVATESPAWTISPDSFGPVTTDMTRAQVLATGAFRERPDRCPYKLVWHDQTFEPNEGVRGQRAASPYLSSIEFWDGRLTHIDPGNGVRTDTGIGVGDTVRQLRAAYAGHRIFYNDATPMKGNYEAYYRINGKRSHLLLYVDNGIIEGLTLDPGLIDAEHPISGEGRGSAVC